MPFRVPFSVLVPRLLVDDALWVDLVEGGYPPGQVIWFYKLDTDRDMRGRYPRSWRKFDCLVSTATLRSFTDNLPTGPRSPTPLQGRGQLRPRHPTRRGRKVQGSPL